MTGKICVNSKNSLPWHLQLWWWLSVPYTLIFTLAILIVNLSIGVAEELAPLFALSWLLAWSSALWSAVVGLCAIRGELRGVSSWTMLVLAIAAAALGIRSMNG